MAPAGSFGGSQYREAFPDGLSREKRANPLNLPPCAAYCRHKYGNILRQHTFAKEMPMIQKAYSCRATVSLLASASLLPVLAACSETEAQTITVHKDANCGCCNGWVKHLNGAGFQTVVRNVSDLAEVKKRLGVPDALASCHTGEVEGYVIEGHVPAEAIQRLLAEKPKARGLAVPGMPIGSPGMEGANPETYDVVIFDESSSKPFMKFVETRVVG
jgi:hypothetical protein